MPTDTAPTALEIITRGRECWRPQPRRYAHPRPHDFSQAHALADALVDRDGERGIGIAPARIGLEALTQRRADRGLDEQIGGDPAWWPVTVE